MTVRLILTILRLMARYSRFTATDLSTWLAVSYDDAHAWTTQLAASGLLAIVPEPEAAPVIHAGYRLTERGMTVAIAPLIDHDTPRLQEQIALLEEDIRILRRANRSFAESVQVPYE